MCDFKSTRNAHVYTRLLTLFLDNMQEHSLTKLTLLQSGWGQLPLMDPALLLTTAYVSPYLRLPPGWSLTHLFEVVIYKSTVKQSVNAQLDLTQKIFLGRPWTRKYIHLVNNLFCVCSRGGCLSEWARVAFLNTDLSSIINPAGWEQWSSSTPNTADVQFVEGGNTGEINSDIFV